MQNDVPGSQIATPKQLVRPARSSVARSVAPTAPARSAIACIPPSAAGLPPSSSPGPPPPSPITGRLRSAPDCALSPPQPASIKPITHAIRTRRALAGSVPARPPTTARTCGALGTTDPSATGARAPTWAILSRMSSYYLSEDLARFSELGKTNPKLFDLFMKWYGATMEKGALDENTKKLIALAVDFAIQEPYCIDSYTPACMDA